MFFSVLQPIPRAHGAVSVPAHKTYTTYLGEWDVQIDSDQYVLTFEIHFFGQLLHGQFGFGGGGGMEEPVFPHREELRQQHCSTAAPLRHQEEGRWQHHGGLWTLFGWIDGYVVQHKTIECKKLQFESCRRRT